MKLLFFFIICFNCYCLIAQNNQVHDLIVSAIKKDSLGNYAEALMDVEKAIELSKHQNDTALLLHGKILAETNDIKSAQKDVKEVFKHNRQSAEAYYLSATLKVKTENYDGAIKDFSKSLQLNPTNCKAYYNRGLSHALMNDIKEAISDFSKSIEINPNYTMAYFNRAYWKDINGNTEDALIDLLIAKELDNTNKEIYLELAVIYAKLNKYDDSCDALKKAIAFGHTFSEDLQTQFCK